MAKKRLAKIFTKVGECESLSDKANKWIDDNNRIIDVYDVKANYNALPNSNIGIFVIVVMYETTTEHLA